VIVNLLDGRSDAASILTAAADRLGVPFHSIRPGLDMELHDSRNTTAVDRAPYLTDIRDALAKWHAWAASCRRIRHISRQISRMTPPSNPRVTRVSTWSERDADARADALSLTSSSAASEPVGLPFTTPDELPAELQSSKYHSIICRLLNSRVDITHDRWRHRSLYTEANWAEWTTWQSHQHTHRDANEHGRIFSDRQQMLIAPDLRSHSSRVQADAWNHYRRHLLTELRSALTVGFPWTEILRRLHTTLSDPEQGYPRLINYIQAACEDHVLLRYPLLHADVLIYQLDNSYAAGNPKYSNESCTIDWDRATARLPGEDPVTLAIRVINAYIVKSNNPKLTDVTVWLDPSITQEINKRYCECLGNDEADPDRGADLAREFKTQWYSLLSRK